MRVRFTLFILLLCFSLLPATAAAQEAGGPITLRAQAGFDGFHKGEGWVPVQVTLANNGPAVDGTIRIDLGPNRPIFTAPVELPNQSNKRVSLSVFLPATRTNLTIRLLEGEHEIGSVAVNSVRSLDPDSVLYGVVSPEPDSLDFLEKVTAGRAEAAVAFVDIDDLPADKTAWEDLDVLIFNDVDSNQLSAAQREALEAWLYLGGQLVVTGGASWQQTAAAFTDLLPVTPTGSESFSDLPALAEETGEPFRDPGPYVVTTSTLRDGELLFRQDGTPLLARRSAGRGNVFFLALDPKFAPLDDWDGSEVLWAEIGQYVPYTPVWGLEFRNEGEANSAVEALPSLTLPSSLFLMCFLLAYVVLIGPVNYFVLKRLNRKELAWVTIPVTILVFSLIAYVAGFQIKGNRVIINQMSLAYGRTDAPEMQVHTALGIYSPRRASYDVVLEEDVQVRNPDNFSTSFERSVIARGSQVVIEDTIVDVGGVRTYVANSRRPTPPLTGEVTLRQSGNTIEMDVTVTNNAEFTLENAILLIGDRSIAIGNLAPGTTTTKTSRLIGDELKALEISQGAPVPFESITAATSRGAPLESHYFDLLGTSSYFRDREVYPRYRLLQSLGEGFNPSPRPAWRPQGVVTLVGWAQQPQLEVGLGSGRHDTSATTLYFLELPFAK